MGSRLTSIYASRKFRNGCYCTKERWLLFLLKSQDCNMGMMRAFLKSTETSITSTMRNLRLKGHHISCVGEGGTWHYVGYFP